MSNVLLVFFATGSPAAALDCAWAPGAPNSSPATRVKTDNVFNVIILRSLLGKLASRLKRAKGGAPVTSLASGSVLLSSCGMDRRARTAESLPCRRRWRRRIGEKSINLMIGSKLPRSDRCGSIVPCGHAYPDENHTGACGAVSRASIFGQNSQQILRSGRWPYFAGKDLCRRNLPAVVSGVDFIPRAENRSL